MILQALTEYYRTLANSGKISPPGWGNVKVSYALCIGANGGLEQVVSVQTEQPILLSYFLDMSDAEIGELLNVVRTTVFRHRKSALAKIKQYLEGKADDEYR